MSEQQQANSDRSSNPGVHVSFVGDIANYGLKFQVEAFVLSSLLILLPSWLDHKTRLLSFAVCEQVSCSLVHVCVSAFTEKTGICSCFDPPQL